MRKKILGIFICMLLIAASTALTGTVLADWDEGDGHKMHYPQLPKEGGWDIMFTPRLADDWECSKSGPVKDIHFWISWKQDHYKPPGSFLLEIWPDDPSVPKPNYKQGLLWDRHFGPGDFIVRNMTPDLQGWFDPLSGQFNQNDHTKWAQINIVNISDPFIQEEDTIYWLEIDYWMDAGVTGWKESGSPQFRGNAGFQSGLDWIELIDPITGEGMDMAFVITANNPPLKPTTPNGPTSGTTGVSYPYTTSATDPDGNLMRFGWDWNGTGLVDQWDDNGGSWYNSGQLCTTSHSWSTQGTYPVRVMAEDVHGAGSVWSNPLSVTIPRNRAINTPFLNFLQNHPNLFPLLRLLLQRLGLQ